MRISKFMAVAASGCALAAAVTLPAVAGTGATHHPAVASKTKTFPSTVTPSSVKPGQTITLHGHGALKKTTYNCLFIVIKGANYGTDIASDIFPKSTKHGKLTCHLKFKPFSAKPLTGPTRHCPLKKADKKAGFKCAVAVSTTNMKSASRSFFTAKK